MLIRMTYRDNYLVEQIITEGPDFVVPSSGHLKASCTDKEHGICILCGSLWLLLGGLG